jgi:hypothetical protein
LDKKTKLLSRNKKIIISQLPLSTANMTEGESSSPPYINATLKVIFPKKNKILEKKRISKKIPI